MERKMRRFLGIRGALAAVVTVVGMALAGPAPASSPPELAGRIDSAAATGAARGTFLALPLFDAELFTEGGRPFSWSEPFALSLTYRRSFGAGLLVWASMTEMQRLRSIDPGAANAIEARLDQCFRTVQRGDRITAVSETPDRATFFLNGQPTCTLEHPGFRRAFFSIWLDPGARDPAGAARLRGAASS